ncbi:gag-pol polyprotein [Tanacetum coccineum]
MQTSSRQVEALVVTRGKSMEPGSSGSHNHEENGFININQFLEADLCKVAMIIRIRSIMVKMHGGIVRTTRDVRHVKGLKKNLVSLGQLNDLGCKILDERKLLPGLTKVSLPFWKLCFISKKHRLKFKTSNSKSVSVLELVYFDIWQAPVQSLRGSKYFVSFISDYSRRCWVYPIKKKSDVFEVFKVYKTRVELDSRKKIKCLRTNNRGGYTFDEVDTFFELKTLLEMWTRNPINYSDLHIFGSPMYVMYNSQETIKMDLKSKKCLFLGYADGVKGYRLWDTTAHKMENEFQTNDFFEASPQHEVNETNESQAPVTQEGEPSTLPEALNNPDALFWKATMQEKTKALHKNKTWDLMPQPGGRKPNEYKWVYKIKNNSDDKVERPLKDRINILKAQPAREFEMKDLGPVNKIWGCKFIRDRVLGVVSPYIAEPSKEHWETMKRIHRYIKGTSNVVLCFGESDLTVKRYVDSDYVCDLDGSKSTTGYVFTLSGKTVSWVSKLQTIVAISTTESEYVVGTQVNKEVVWLKMLLEELKHKQEKITLIYDNQSALYLARNPTFHLKTKHILVQYHFIHEKVEEGTVDI